MADRNVVGSNTFEQFRVEFNELATDVGDIASITGASGIIASATDVIEAVVSINTSVGNELDLPDSSGVNVGRIKLGDSDDLQIYHNGNNSYIDEVGTGNLYIRASDSVRLQSSTGEQGVIVETDGAVTLYYDNSKKLETSASGVAITGNLTATGNLQTSGNLINGSINLTFPTVSGTISTEGFSIALATALG